MSIAPSQKAGMVNYNLYYNVAWPLQLQNSDRLGFVHPISGLVGNGQTDSKNPTSTTLTYHYFMCNIPKYNKQHISPPLINFWTEPRHLVNTSCMVGVGSHDRATEQVHMIELEIKRAGLQHYDAFDRIHDFCKSALCKYGQ